MHATAACGHSGVVLLGRCCTSLDCCLFAPTVLATSRYGLLRAYTGEAGRLKRNCFESVGDSSRAGGDGGCVAGLSVVLLLMLCVTISTNLTDVLLINYTWIGSAFI